MGKTLKKIYLNRIENIYNNKFFPKCNKYSIKVKYSNKIDDYGHDIIYLTDFEKTYQAYEIATYSSKDDFVILDKNEKINKIPLKKLYNFFEQRKIMKKKIYNKHSSSVSYQYYLPITNKITIETKTSCNAQIAKAHFEDVKAVNDYVLYIFTIYIYPNKCMNYDIYREVYNCSPDWFYDFYSKNKPVKNFKHKRKNIIVRDINFHLYNFSNMLYEDIDLEQIEKN